MLAVGRQRSDFCSKQDRLNPYPKMITSTIRGRGFPICRIDLSTISRAQFKRCQGPTQGKHGYMKTDPGDFEKNDRKDALYTDKEGTKTTGEADCGK